LLRLRKLSAEFREVFRGGESQALAGLDEKCRAFRNRFAGALRRGIERDFAAVLSAAETCWSNGQVEGRSTV